VRGNKGARTAGVDRVAPAFITGEATIEAFLAHAREQLKAGTFVPLPVRERLIPKPASGASGGGSASPPRWIGSGKRP
jgi:RNA-directed DNA polymerase